MRVAWLLLTACSASAPPHGPPWVDGPALPQPRLEPGVVAVGDQLVVIGGFTDAHTITDQVDELDTIDSAAQWQKLPPLPQQWTHIQVAAIGTRVYVLGGLLGGFNGNDYVASGETYVLETGDPSPTWQPLTPIPAGYERGSAGVVVTAPKIFLLGGAASSSPDPRAGALASNLIYDTQTDTWCVPDGSCPDALPDLPAPRSHPAASRQPDGTFVVAGGLSTLLSVDAVGDVYWLGVGDTSWTTKTPMPAPRGGCAYGTIGGRLICAGGEEPCPSGACAIVGALAYEPYQDDGTHDPWCVLTNLPDFRAGTQGAAVGNRLFVPGGAELIMLQPQSTLFEYSSGDDPALEPIPDTGHDTKLCKN